MSIHYYYSAYYAFSYYFIYYLANIVIRNQRNTFTNYQELDLCYIKLVNPIATT